MPDEKDLDDRTVGVHFPIVMWNFEQTLPMCSAKAPAQRDLFDVLFDVHYLGGVWSTHIGRGG